VSKNTKIFFVNFGEKEALYALKTIKDLRKNGISAELYPEEAKMRKQMNYADKRAIPYVVLAGSKEMKNKQFTLRNMKTGEQNLVDFEAMLAEIAI
ncbi:MAG TPA: His/Gly/Thr/Pro-type tRNA ligase C-terminal domain-containing protein, partial [Flavobacteriaceae bacterium]|nr:His/Gly/Thr/Pro-type tRNA ligase C-terminal domain-containing protein [Flavobacteriaceae bacterium]